MAVNNETIPQAPSLVVKLRYTPICGNCLDMLSKWCLPKTYVSFHLPGDGLPLTRQSLALLDGGHLEEPAWIWNIRTLKVASTRCRSCKFLISFLDASPWIPYRDNDYLQLSPQLMGSQHSRQNSPAYFTKGTLRLGVPCPDTNQPSTYTRYYRPKLQMYQLSPDARPNSAITSIAAKRVYTPEASTFILPVAQADESASGEAVAFLGRRVNAKVSISQLQSWYRLCRTTHNGAPESHATNRIYNNPENWCSRHRAKFLPPTLDFRLVDVRHRCVVRATKPTGYAALSYVWGDAKRLLLYRENEQRLSTPGTLSDDKECVSKTFRDALRIAESLSIHYIWIDALSLCSVANYRTTIRQHHSDIVYSSLRQRQSS